jgi:cytochrome c biogenesis DsbD-like protein
MAGETSGSITPSSMPKGWLALLMSFVIPILVVVGFLFLLISLRHGAEAAMASFATLLPVGYAFAAGMVASVNPCGFFILPSYLSYHLGTEEAGFYEAHVVKRLGKALLLGSMATIGFVVVFALVGAIIATGGYWLVSGFPYAGVAIGVAMMGLGMWLLVTRRSIGIMAASRLSITAAKLAQCLPVWHGLRCGISELHPASLPGSGGQRPGNPGTYELL